MKLAFSVWCLVGWGAVYLVGWSGVSLAGWLGGLFLLRVHGSEEYKNTLWCPDLICVKILAAICAAFLLYHHCKP